MTVKLVWGGNKPYICHKKHQVQWLCLVQYRKSRKGTAGQMATPVHWN
jgi:hypothetical protein